MRSPDGDTDGDNQNSRCQGDPRKAWGMSTGWLGGTFCLRSERDETGHRGVSLLVRIAATILNRTVENRTVELRGSFLRVVLLAGLGASSLGQADIIANGFTAVLVSLLVLAATILFPAFRDREIGGNFILRIASRMVAGWKNVMTSVMGCDRPRLAAGSTEIRQNLLGLNLTLAQGGKIVGYGLFFIQPNLTGIGAYEAFVKDTAGKLVKVLVFKRAQHARADLSGIGNGIEREAALLALLAKFFPERSHGPLRRAVLSFRSASRRKQS